MRLSTRHLARSCWRVAATTAILGPMVGRDAQDAAAISSASRGWATTGGEGQGTAPWLALAHPAPGGSVPQDRPVVLFRFASADPDDPVDARSLAVTLDGADRSALFKIVGDEAWGPLAPPPGRHGHAIAAGAHELAARICSVRGVCTELTVAVSVSPSAALTSDGRTGVRWKEILALVLEAVRKLIS